ncbi:uncharacterized protein PV09_09436 [Verruconis gallopava]|uniref:6-phosphogluconolactonase n=1 Tax=Verruconis gallopava TaxID=253628 RepID=A0A0D2AIR6_9PEZI|nr:uncharacterized protein PV09_09436 [Verruconis gallopava]KIV98823.1 hypothetical protein PV09_09436 [Verruconis gallopava]
MFHKLLVSGDRADFTLLAFNPVNNELGVIANYKAPFNASWVEVSASTHDIDHLIGLSEGDESGLLYTFKIDHVRNTCEITSQQPTLGAPAHFITLRDNSAVALATYMGGSVALYSASITKDDGLLLTDTPRVETLPAFPYEQVGHGPNADRQRQCHIHQVVETRCGLLYAPDLGSDRVWILRRHETKLEVCGWLECPAGTGPRHAVISPDEKIMYVIGELSHTVIAFCLPSNPTNGILPLNGFAPNVIPPTVHPDHQYMMDAAEICLHPFISNVLYVSNRWERHIKQRQPHLQNVPEDLPPGDDVAIILLSEDGTKVECIKHVRTGVDVIRGMRLSNGGQFVVVVGQEGGGVEVYKIGGDKGDNWTLAARLNDSIEGGLKHAIWL